MTLTKFEKHPVTAVGMTIPGAAGGLREPLAVAPVEYHLDDVVHVVMQLKVQEIRFDPIPDSDDGSLTRIHVMKVLATAFIDATAVAPALDATKQAIEESKGVLRLPLDNDPPSEPQPESDPLDVAASEPRQTEEQAAAILDPTLQPASV